MTTARKIAVPDPESRPRPKRRTFSKEYKTRILEELDRVGVGGTGALLRREGLYSSTLSAWRKERRLGTLMDLSGKKRGPKANPQRAELEQLKRKLTQAEKRLEVAEQVIAAQKKLCALLALPSATEDESSS